MVAQRTFAGDNKGIRPLFSYLLDLHTSVVNFINEWLLKVDTMEI